MYKNALNRLKNISMRVIPQQTTYTYTQNLTFTPFFPSLFNFFSLSEFFFRFSDFFSSWRWRDAPYGSVKGNYPRPPNYQRKEPQPNEHPRKISEIAQLIVIRNEHCTKIPTSSASERTERGEKSTKIGIAARNKRNAKQ